MNKSYYTFLFFLMFLLVIAKTYAQTNTEDEVTFAAVGMTKLYVGGYVKVELIEGTEEKVVFNASPEVKKLIKVRMSKGNLNIQAKNKRLQKLSYQMTKINVYYKKLEAVKVRKGAKLTAKQLIKAKDFDLVAIEGGSVKMKLQTKNVKARISTGAEVLLEGTTDIFDVKVKMGAELEAYTFKSNICLVKAGMGAYARVFAREALRMSAGMGSSIKYKGNPKEILKHSAWMGSDIKKN